MTHYTDGKLRIPRCALALGVLAWAGSGAWAADDTNGGAGTVAASAASSSTGAAAAATPAGTAETAAAPEAAGAAAAPRGAQGRAAPAGTVSGESSGPLQQVVVTATRREESANRVPISLTAMSQDQMDQLGVKDFDDLVKFVPGVSIDTSGTNAISIRGISSSAGAGTTGIYIDDTPIQMRDIGFNPDDTLPRTFDLQRVEVLRGPQGTLFGSGSEGGTVRYILTQPSLTESSTYVRSEVDYSEVGDPSYEMGAAHGAPIIDGTLGYRVSVWYREDGGWIDRVDSSTDDVIQHNINTDGTLMARLAAIWSPVSSLTITPEMLYQNQKKGDESTYWPAYSNPDAGQFNTATPERMPVPDEYYLPSLKIEWDLGSSLLIADTSYYHRWEQTAYQGTVYDLSYFQSLAWPNNPLTGYLGITCGAADNPGLAVTSPPCPWYPLLDGSGIHLPPGFEDYETPNIMTNRQDSYVQEIRWQSADPAARFNWTVGVFWQLAKESSIEELRDTEDNSFFEALYGETQEQIVSAVNGYPSPYYSCPGQTPGYVYTAIPQCDIYYNANTTFDRQIAGYGEVSYAFTSQLKLTLGERVAHTTFSLDHYADGLENYGPSPASANESSNPNTPKASLSFQMDPRDLFYFTYAKGFRVGGGNPPLPTYCSANLAQEGFPNGAPLTYAPDTTQDYEVGSKNVLGGWLQLATSVYWIKWNNIQQNVYVGGDCGLQFTDNLGTAVSKGFDLQGTVLLGHFHVDMALGYTNARFTAVPARVSCAGGVCAPVAPLVEPGDAISGQASINYAPGLNPPWNIALGPEYDFKLGDHDAFVRADWTFQSRNPWPSSLQDPRTSQYYPYTYTLPSTSFTSLRAGINFGDWLVSLFCDNVFNSHTILNYQLSTSDPYNPAGSPSVQENDYTYRPLTVGLEATLHLSGT
jgi:iron complex outermembrane recepter protein